MMRLALSYRTVAGIFAGCFAASVAQAMPTGGSVSGVSGGGVTISRPGVVTTVDSTAHRAVVDWTSFTVNPGETVNFLLPDKDAILVNRSTSQIDINGAVNSHYGPNGGAVGGSVWFLSPAGVLFGANAVVNVGGLLATTAGLTSQSAFLAAADTDPIAFSGGTFNSSVTLNAGAQVTVNDGSAIFAADVVNTSGSVVGTGAFATDTKILFGGARAFTLSFSVNPPDPLRASDLALFDFNIDTPGIDVIQQAPAVTSAGQVIFAEIGDVSRLQSGFDAPLQISGGSVTATGQRSDGADLVFASENIVGGAPAGQPLTSRVFVAINRPTPQSPQVTITSAGGLYLSGDVVTLGEAGDQAAILSVKGPTQINGNAVILTDAADQITPTINPRQGLTPDPQSFTYITINDTLGNTHLGSLSTPGSVSISSSNNVSAGPIASGGNTSVYAGGSVSLSTVTASSLNAVSGGGDLTLNGAVNVQTGASFTSAGVFRNTAPITVSAATSPNLPTTDAGQPLLTITANDVDIGAPITVRDTPVNSGAIVLTNTNPLGSAIGDGLTGAGNAYALSGAELAQLSADDLTFIQQGAGALRLGNFTVDAARLHEMNIEATGSPTQTRNTTTQSTAPLATASIEGVVQAVGDPMFSLGGAGLGQITVSGSLGTPTAPFSSVSLAAPNIYFGSQAFIAQDQAGAYPAGYTYSPGQGGIDPNHVYVAANSLALSATGVIVQQSTSLVGGGLALGSLAITGPPTRVDLFGTLQNAQGAIVGGPAAAISGLITVPAGAAANNYRFNSCVIGQPGRCSNQTTALLSVVRPQDLSGLTSDQLTPLTPVINQFQDFQKKRRRTEILSGLANEDFRPLGTP